MASRKFACLCTLAVFPGIAQVQVNRFSSTFQPVLTSVPSPRFAVHSDPAAPPLPFRNGFVRATRSMAQTYTVVHRYFFDELTHLYFGYDMLITEDTPNNSYRVSYYDLAVGPLDFVSATTSAPNPAEWKKLPTPALPATKTMQPTDTADITVYVDPASGQKLIDTMSFTMMPQVTAGVPISIPMSRAMVMARNGTGPTIEPPYVTGTAREFTASDAEMHMQRVRVTLNGNSFDAGNRAVNGSLLWLYVPRHGRYILSLSPRAELGFVKAGEMRAGIVKFKVDDDDVLIESPIAIAPGDAPYILYVLHDPDWGPTAQGQDLSLQLGSVSPGEIAALNRK